MSTRQFHALIAALVGGMLLSWLLLVPPGAQPDEHSHLVRAGALVRLAEGTDGFYSLPDRYLMPDPACYAFDPLTPAACTAPYEPTGEHLLLLTRADDYPPGGHAVTGAATLLPGLEPVWWARLAGVAFGVVFLSSALVLALRRSRLFAAALLLSVTPMAWSSLPSANPSTFAISGAAALWVALLTLAPDGRIGAAVAWLVAGGWSAMVLSRRDGLVWACIIVFVVAVVRRWRLLDLVRRLGPAAVGVVAAATVITLVWGLTSESRTSQLVVVAPLLLVAAELARARLDTGPPELRWWAIAIAALVGLIAWPLLVSTRGRGWDTDLTITIVNQTDDNLVEAIGRLGWLDTPLPAFAVFVWLVAIGGLVAHALLAERRGLVGAGAVVAVAAVSSWTFELLQNNDSGTYWQGRYSIPLLIGVPLLLAQASTERFDAEIRSWTDRITTWTAVTGLVVVNIAAWAAARRWGVGLGGSYVPWRWDTAIQPVPPLLVLIVLAGCSAALGRMVLDARHTGRPAQRTVA